MKVIDPGHEYELRELDRFSKTDILVRPPQVLTFVKREGDGYPGNVGHHPGTTTQEVLRALIERTKYVDNQIPCGENSEVLDCLRHAIYFLEDRAARRHDRAFELTDAEIDHIEDIATCDKCGHIGCEGECRE